MKFLSNSFSAQMLTLHHGTLYVEFKQVSRDDFIEGLKEGFTSVIGHSVTAKFLGNELGLPIYFQRYTVKLDEGDELYIAQYSGGRLREGMDHMPEGASFKYIVARLVEVD